jgi:uncharacterized protein YndB with AHSA1/START domain
MFDLLQDEDPARAERVMRAMLAMGKIDLDVLERVWRGGVPRPEIVVETVVRIPVEKAWDVWTKPEHILRWNQASEDWHTTAAMNDLRAGGRFSSRMEAKDGGAGFDFFGVHDRVEPLRVVSSTLGDGRHLRVEFTPDGGSTHVRELFEAEGTNPPDLQRQGWQSILDHYRAYAEGMA